MGGKFEGLRKGPGSVAIETESIAMAMLFGERDGLVEGKMAEFEFDCGEIWLWRKESGEGKMDGGEFFLSAGNSPAN